MAQPLTIALPKGRLTDDALGFLARAGYAVPANGDGGRKLVLDGADGRLRFIMVKPADVPVFVEYGAADVGVAGLDVVREAERDVYEPLHLPFGYCRLAVAGPVDRADLSLRLERSPRVATKFPRLTEAYFRKRGVAAELIVMRAFEVDLERLSGARIERDRAGQAAVCSVGARIIHAAVNRHAVGANVPHRHGNRGVQ